MERKYKRVIIIGADGCGAFFKQADTPNMDRIFAAGAATYNAVTSYPSISAECWGSMLHGVRPEFHGLTNTTAGTGTFDMESQYPSVFRLIREHYPEAKLASFCCWKTINKGIIEDEIGVHKFSAGHDDVVKDNVVAYINENDFDFIFVQFDSTDNAGHKFGYGSQGHLDQINVIDSYIGEIYNAICNNKMIDDTLFIVTTDHGGLPIQVHGGDSDEEMLIFIGVAGSGVIKGEIENDGGISVRDISAIVLYALGIDIPDNMEAVVPQILFTGYWPKPSIKRKEIPVKKEYNRPLFETNEFIKSAINSGKVRSILKFDGSISDELANCAPKAIGKISFVNTEKGKAVDLSEGYISLGLYKVGMDNFSISFWIKLLNDKTDAVLVSNRDAAQNACPGFSYITTGDGIQFHAGNGNIETACMNTFKYNELNDDGWRHITLSLNHRAQNVVVYCDFVKTEDQLFDSTLERTKFDSLELSIGRDSC